MDDASVFGWLASLDELDYYELLGVSHDATSDEVRDAFRAFAATFHPDGHTGRSPRELAALDAIFKRGTEAYTVLGDPALRQRYDDGVAKAPSTTLRISLAPGGSQPAPPQRLEDHAKDPAARPFVRRAEELANAGDLKQAKLQMVMANFHDPGNAAFEAYLHEIQERLARRP